MLLLVLLLTIASMAAEITIVIHVPFIGALLKRFRIASLAFSFVLSWFAGAAFGAAGLLVFAAGIMSTILMQPVYWAMDVGLVARIGEWVEEAKAWTIHNRDELMRRWMQVVALVKFLLKLCAIPFVVLGILADAVERAYHSYQDALIWLRKVRSQFTIKG